MLSNSLGFISPAPENLCCHKGTPCYTRRIGANFILNEDTMEEEIRQKE